LNAPPGKYTIKLNVRDVGTGAVGTLVKEFEVVKKFGFIRTRFTAPFVLPVRTPEEDPFPPAPPVVVPGQSLWLHYALVGFAHDKKGHPDVSIELKIVDAATGKETTKAAKARVRPAIKANGPVINFQPIPLELYKPGRYQVKLISKDNVSGATAERVLDLLVLDQ
jgi:hypothetical protein